MEINEKFIAKRILNNLEKEESFKLFRHENIFNDSNFRINTFGNLIELLYELDGYVEKKYEEIFISSLSNLYKTFPLTLYLSSRDLIRMTNLRKNQVPSAEDLLLSLLKKYMEYPRKVMTIEEIRKNLEISRTSAIFLVRNAGKLGVLYFILGKEYVAIPILEKLKNEVMRLLYESTKIYRGNTAWVTNKDMIKILEKYTKKRIKLNPITSSLLYRTILFGLNPEIVSYPKSHKRVVIYKIPKSLSESIEEYLEKKKIENNFDLILKLTYNTEVENNI